MTTTLFRIFKYGFQSFRRNGLISIATIAVMILALLVFEGLIIFGALTDSALSSIQDKIDISVYFKTSAGENEITGIQKSLANIKEIKSVEYIPRDKALESFKEKRKDDPLIKRALDELDENPLLASLNVKTHDPKDYELVASYLENESFKNIVERVTFAQSKSAIDRLSSIVDTVKKIGLALAVFLALTAALVIFNTIRLAIHGNREEIGVMRLVGASNIFISGPYIIQAIIFGVLSAVLALLITAPFISFGAPYIQTFVPEMDLNLYFYGNLVNIFIYLLIFGSILAIASGAIAVRRYLKI